MLYNQLMKTWDGQPVSYDFPYGATILVYRQTEELTGCLSEDRFEFLVLHRSFYGTDYQGDWAWTPPSGARLPGESIETCAKRELYEETGLSIDIEATNLGGQDWLIFIASIGSMKEIILSTEHDHYEWVTNEDTHRRCQPLTVGKPFLKSVKWLEKRYGTQK